MFGCYYTLLSFLRTAEVHGKLGSMTVDGAVADLTTATRT